MDYQKQKMTFKSTTKLAMIMAVLLLQLTTTARSYQITQGGESSLDLDLQNLALQFADNVYQSSTDTGLNQEQSQEMKRENKNSLFNQQLELQSKSQQIQERVSKLNSYTDKNSDLNDVKSSKWFKDMFGEIMTKHERPQTPAAEDAVSYLT